MWCLLRDSSILQWLTENQAHGQWTLNSMPPLSLIHFLFKLSQRSGPQPKYKIHGFLPWLSPVLTSPSRPTGKDLDTFSASVKLQETSSMFPCEELVSIQPPPPSSVSTSCHNALWPIKYFPFNSGALRCPSPPPSFQMNTCERQMVQIIQNIFLESM